MVDKFTLMLVFGALLYFPVIRPLARWFQGSRTEDRLARWFERSGLPGTAPAKQEDGR